ncbi:hypothetical protein BJ138DRAFT_1021330 [Hygrophoropsis aurantiaca]|uniref:Uncharacterized protein n=1 Tax=Hygrophoropsis aurantiaca TaxID=72124 RepID=A0ACB7ZPE0_9AGAM|nr:hypothetical protein BJ138DRAFT_1021330 [Hygrophoropsis aurantiaca]
MPYGSGELPRPRLNGLQKKQNQWRRWAQDVLPSLIVPYLAYLRQSKSLRRRPDPPASQQCSKGCSQKNLEIICVLFDHLDTLQLLVCPCYPAPHQLISRGLFACAPLAPSLAVDLRVLELVKTLFVRITPNTTAWCEALEAFLYGRGYPLVQRAHSYRLRSHLPTYSHITICLCTEFDCSRPCPPA